MCDKKPLVTEPMLQSERMGQVSDKAGADKFTRPNVRALATTLALSVAWTLAQLVGAEIANSSSLRSDALAMCVDCLAYAFNLASEIRPDRDRALKLAAPLLSAAILLVVTALSLSDAIATLQGVASDVDASDVVDGGLVLGFGAAMLIVDLLMLRAIFFRGAGDGTGDGGNGGAVVWCGVSPRSELNLFSGLSHVAADTLRSLTQVTVGTVILAGGPSEVVDAYGTLAISSTIMLGAVFLLYEVALQCAEPPGGLSVSRDADPDGSR